MTELKHTLKRAARNKAPGDNNIPMELWKRAPEWALEILLKEVNTALETGEMHETWRGGVVHLLFKKRPTQSIGNWRPVCMTNVTYRLFAAIMAQRLKRVAEHYGVLEDAQEGF